MTEFRREIRPITLRVKGRVYIVEGVPVLVDPFTDEVLLEEAAARRVLELIQGAVPSRVEETPVYAF
jgi:hypothetical protein